MHRLRRLPRLGSVLLSLVIVAVGFFAFALSHASFAEQSHHVSGGLTNTTSVTGHKVLPTFAGRILHWSVQEYSYELNGKDPANGQVITSDVWVKVDQNGRPVLVHITATLPDGTLHQEILATPSTDILFLGSDYAKLLDAAENPHWCTSTESTPPDAILRYLPIFVDPVALVRKGFVRSDPYPARSTPNTLPLAGHSPLFSYAPSSHLSGWIAEASMQDGKAIYQTNVDENGRVVANDTLVMGGDGSVQQETWSSVGRLEIYGPSAVPSTAFVLVTNGECKR